MQFMLLIDKQAFALQGLCLANRLLCGLYDGMHFAVSSSGQIYLSGMGLTLLGLKIIETLHGLMLIHRFSVLIIVSPQKGLRRHSTFFAGIFARNLA